jgi:large subunit ribosomal protein L15
MDLSTLESVPGARKQRKRVGRGPGSGTGKTSGKGHKGQRARSGAKQRAGFEGGQMPLHRRLPKRGFRHQKRWPMAIVNVDLLDQSFEDGAEVDTELLLSRHLVPDLRGGVKLLGRGEIQKKIVLRVQAASPGAVAKIEAAGGRVELAPRTAAAGAAGEETKE